MTREVKQVQEKFGKVKILKERISRIEVNNKRLVKTKNKKNIYIF